MEIVALIIGMAFCVHLLVMWIQRMKKDNRYNQNIVIQGGRIVGNGQMGNAIELMYLSNDDSSTLYAGGPKPSVTSSFPQIQIRLHDIGIHTCYDYILTDKVIIGRYCQGSDAGIQLQDNMVSKKHCKIYRQGEKIYVQDLGSTNHTYLNGCVLDGTMPLLCGDILKIGQSSYQFQCFR